MYLWWYWVPSAVISRAAPLMALLVLTPFSFLTHPLQSSNMVHSHTHPSSLSFLLIMLLSLDFSSGHREGQENSCDIIPSEAFVAVLSGPSCCEREGCRQRLRPLPRSSSVWHLEWRPLPASPVEILWTFSLYPFSLLKIFLKFLFIRGSMRGGKGKRRGRNRLPAEQEAQQGARSQNPEIKT